MSSHCFICALEVFLDFWVCGLGLLVCWFRIVFNYFFVPLLCFSLEMFFVRTGGFGKEGTRQFCTNGVTVIYSSFTARFYEPAF